MPAAEPVIKALFPAKEMRLVSGVGKLCLALLDILSTAQAFERLR
jgi:hypothetical protein